MTVRALEALDDRRMALVGMFVVVLSHGLSPGFQWIAQTSYPPQGDRIKLIEASIAVPTGPAFRQALA
jgi:hypothetical protein